MQQQVYDFVVQSTLLYLTHSIYLISKVYITSAQLVSYWYGH